MLGGTFNALPHHCRLLLQNLGSQIRWEEVVHDVFVGGFLHGVDLGVGHYCLLVGLRYCFSKHSESFHHVASEGVQIVGVTGPWPDIEHGIDESRIFPWCLIMAFLR